MRALPIAPSRPVADRVALTLPEPPSVNALYENVSPSRRAMAAKHGRKLPGRVKTERYSIWLTAAGWEINRQRPGRIAGPYEITVILGPTRIDIGNAIKAVEDLLQEHGVIENDNLARRITIELDEKPITELVPGTVRVILTPRTA